MEVFRTHGQQGWLLQRLLSSSVYRKSRLDCTWRLTRATHTHAWISCNVCDARARAIFPLADSPPSAAASITPHCVPTYLFLVILAFRPFRLIWPFGLTARWSVTSTEGLTNLVEHVTKIFEHS